jgi:acyl-CoA synthetase (AMP-forming)/AMP-acid ligase II
LEPDVEWAQSTENINNPDAWEFMKYAQERVDDDTYGRKINGEMLRLWCLKEQLARFKVPKEWVVVEDDFPRNSGGKIDVSELRRAITVGRSDV